MEKKQCFKGKSTNALKIHLAAFPSWVPAGNEVPISSDSRQLLLLEVAPPRLAGTPAPAWAWHQGRSWGLYKPSL